MVVDGKATAHDLPSLNAIDRRAEQTAAHDSSELSAEYIYIYLFFLKV